MIEAKLPRVKSMVIEGTVKSHKVRKVKSSNNYKLSERKIKTDHATYSIGNPNPDWKIKGEKWIEYALSIDKSNYTELNGYDIAYIPCVPITILQGSEQNVMPNYRDINNPCFHLGDILEFDDNKCISFVKKFYGAIWVDSIRIEKTDWLNSAKIERIDGNKVVRIFNLDHEMVFNINNMNTEIFVELDRINHWHYAIRTKNDISEVYRKNGNFSYSDNSFRLNAKYKNPENNTIGKKKNVDLSPSDDAEIILDLLKFAEIIYDAPILKST